MWDPPDYVPPPPPKRPTGRRPLVIGTVAGVLGIGAIAALTEPEDISGTAETTNVRTTDQSVTDWLDLPTIKPHRCNTIVHPYPTRHNTNRADRNEFRFRAGHSVPPHGTWLAESETPFS